MPSPLGHYLPVCLLAVLCGGQPAGAQQAAPLTQAPGSEASLGARQPSRDIEANLLVLEIRLNGASLSDGLTAYQEGAQILLPLGELARLLTLAITVQPSTSSASGYVLKEDRTFGLDAVQSVVSVAGRSMQFEEKRARVIGDDIYVNSALLSRWLPIDFEVNLSAQRVEVKPRERLPLQDRLERELAAQRLKGAGPERVIDPGYPRVLAPYRLIDRPFIDQTFSANVQSAPGSRQLSAAYTAYLTADVLGMEGAAFVSSTRDKPNPDWRITLGRNDPDANLLGPLRARTLSLGNISVPSVPNVMSTSGPGRGVAISNRPLDQPTSFDRQSLRGDLPPGWDVTLYYNGALVGFQASRPDGMYAFDDLPLSFGTNEFQLSFNGPLGQMRTERKTFALDQSIVKPGEVLYSLLQHQAETGGMRSVARFDFGLTPRIAGGASFIRTPRQFDGANGLKERSFTQLGLRGYWDSAIATSELTLAQDGGMLAEFGLKRRVGDFAVDLLHTQVFGGFESDAFANSGDPVAMRHRLRAVGALSPTGLPRIPVAVEAEREVLKSGATHDKISGRASGVVAGTFVTNALAWQRSGDAVTTDGNLQLSRRVAQMGLSGQLSYRLKPTTSFDSLALFADRNLTSGYRVNAGLLRTFSGSGTTLLTGGMSKNFGDFALVLSASYSSQRQLSLGLQVFIALGHDPRSGKWFTDAVPMAGMGAVSARAFVDRNLNGMRDADEELVPNARFIVNGGSRHPTSTAEDGTVLIGRLAPGRYADLSLDVSTLEDPLWKPVQDGVRVLPRPGLVQFLDFPMVSTSEIDGTVYLLGSAGKRAIGDAVVELVSSDGVVVMSTPSSSDGFYLLRQVMPGRYTLRISPAQASKLALTVPPDRLLEIKPDGDFINGQDLELKPIAR